MLVVRKAGYDLPMIAALVHYYCILYLCIGCYDLPMIAALVH